MPNHDGDTTSRDLEFISQGDSLWQAYTTGKLTGTAYAKAMSQLYQSRSNGNLRIPIDIYLDARGNL
jgi:hypothetical protein